MNAQHEQINPIRVLAKHAQRIATEHGLELRHFAVIPGVEDELDKVQIVMEFDPEKKDKPDVALQQVSDSVTQAMLEAQREALQERAAEARREIEETLKKRLGGGGGFLE